MKCVEVWPSDQGLKQTGKGMGEREAIDGVPTIHIWQESKTLMEILSKIMSRKTPNLVILHLIKREL